MRGVRNNIQVAIAPVFSDTGLAERVRTRLKSNWEVRWVAERINVRVSGGGVTLTGDVDSMAERREAARMAFATEGVASVINKLTVKGVPYPWEELTRDTGIGSSRTDQYYDPPTLFRW